MGLHKVGTHGRQLICEWGVTYPVLERWSSEAAKQDGQR